MNGRKSVLRRLLARPSAVAGLVLLGAILLCTLCADYLSPRGYDEIDLDRALRAPSREDPFGTDPFGRDVLSRAFHGARISLGVGFLARTISLVLGLILGVTAGYFGRKFDAVIMRLADVTLAFPTLLLLIAIMAVVSPGIVSLFSTLGVVGWASMARLVRAQVLSVKEREYVQAARSTGANSPVIIFRHILPQCLSPVLVVYTMGLGMTVMAESSLSFLGLGVQPPQPSWGSMVSGGIAFMRTAPWLTLFPGMLLTATVLAFNLIGDGLRDALDPHLASGAREPGTVR